MMNPLLLLGASGETPSLPMHAQHIFEPLGIPITNSMIVAWIIVIGILVVVRVGTGKITMVPGPMQNFMEACVEGLEAFVGSFLEKKVVHWAFPVLATLFIFILVSNLLGLFPGAGSIGFGHEEAKGFFRSIKGVDAAWFRPPTADANMTLGMAIVFFFANLYWAIKYNGPVGLVKHIFWVKGKPPAIIFPLMVVIFFVVGIIEVVSIGIRPVALAARLYGNIFGGESVLTIMLSMLPGGIAAIPFYFLELIIGIVQASVFFILCIAFTATLCSHTDDGHGEESSH